MTDCWHTLLKFADHNRGFLLALVVAGALAAYMFGCDATTGSLIVPGKPVNSQELRAEARRIESDMAKRRNLLVAEVTDFNDEVARFNESAKEAVSDLERKHEVRRQIVQIVGGFASDAAQGEFNPVSAISTLVTLITVGASAGLALDNYRKGRVIGLLKDNPDDKDAV